MKKQTTIKEKIQFSGHGLHSGKYTNMTLIPASENHGIVFKRIDLEKNINIEAQVENVSSTERSTNLKKNNIEIKTVEHILSAISGHDIDNLLIEIDNEEIPIMDGSAKEFSEGIKKVGKRTQNKNKKYYKVKKKIIYKDKDSGAEFVAIPSENFSVDVTIDYKSKVLGIQNANINNIEEFHHEISESRTFCFLHELESLLENDLIKGGDMSNAIVIVEKEIQDHQINKLSSLFNAQEIKIPREGILNNMKLRYSNEAARHKLLDVIGDLSLLGRSIKSKIQIKKPGHTPNINFVKKLKDIMIKEQQLTPPNIKFDQDPIYNKKQIEKILPHRDPFLFVDEIRQLKENSVVGIKFVKEEEDYFKGHFPGAPVMPGVLQLETMAQVGGVLILSTVEDPENYLTYFMKIDNAKFKQKVLPGDTIIFRLELISPIRRGLCHMQGRGFVNESIVVEAELLAQIVKKS